VSQRFKNAASAPRRPFDHPAVHQEQQDGCAFVQGRLGPELGAVQIVLQVQTGVPNGFIEQGQTVLVIVVRRVVGQSAGPIAGKLLDE
jgi:hypothetical protein